jgi:hypothetical protein
MTSYQKLLTTMDNLCNKIDRKFDALSEQVLAFLLARSEPSQTPPAFTPPSQAKQSQERPLPGS